MAAKKPPAKKAPAKKKAAPKKAAATQNNVLSADEKAVIAEAMVVGFQGRTSPSKLADSFVTIWSATMGKKSYADQVWAPWVTGFGRSDG